MSYDWQGKRVAFLGYGVDVQDVEAYLAERGALVTVLDEKHRPDAFSDLSSYDVLVRSPGVYRYRQEIVDAEKMGVLVTSKMQIFFDVCPTRQIIGVSGTKGKGTTSSLIAEMLRQGGKHVVLGGNIGSGVFHTLGEITSESWVVLELSSFQLFDLHTSPHIAVLLMVTSDHLDWHKDHDEYVFAKSSLVRFQGPQDVLVFNPSYPQTQRLAELTKARRIPVSRQDWQGEVRMRGEHQRENVAAAAAVAREVGISEEIIARVAATFQGLPHRLEEVGIFGGVTYIDDSISTTPETAIAAISACKEPIVLILGGSDKGADFSELAQFLAKSTHVKQLILIGQTADRLQEACVRFGVTIPSINGGGTMDEIFDAVLACVRPGDVVLLSPACASFGMFLNYKDRGDQFAACARRRAVSL